jgi:hypothetical protein
MTVGRAVHPGGSTGFAAAVVPAPARQRRPVLHGGEPERARLAALQKDAGQARAGAVPSQRRGPVRRPGGALFKIAVRRACQDRTDIPTGEDVRSGKRTEVGCAHAYAGRCDLRKQARWNSGSGGSAGPPATTRMCDSAVSDRPLPLGGGVSAVSGSGIRLGAARPSSAGRPAAVVGRRCASRRHSTWTAGEQRCRPCRSRSSGRLPTDPSADVMSAPGRGHRISSSSARRTASLRWSTPNLVTRLRP